jgi:hypothetical protein
VSRPAAPEPRPGFALFVAALLLSPLVLVCWVAGQGVIRVTGWPRWRVGAAAVAGGALVIWIQGGPVPALAAHFAGILGLLGQFGRPMVHLPTPGSFLVPQVALSVPVGLLAASLTRRADLAVPDPAAAVREQRRQVKVERRARVLAARPTDPRKAAESGSAPLGVSLGGDLPASWRAGRFVVLPDHAARLPELAIGQSGAGKSTYIGRRVYLAAGQGRQIVALDGKGDVAFRELLIDAYLAANPNATIHTFPDTPLSAWSGNPAEQVNKLLGCWAWSIEAAYYREVCVLALRLACSAPGLPPVNSMADLVRRLDPPTLARSWAKFPAESALIKTLSPKLGDVVMRVANLAAAVAGQLDGDQAIGQSDLCIISLPTLANRGDSEALFRILMGDVGHWISDKQRRPGRRPAFLVIDEFSSVSGARAGAIDVMERGRSFQVPSLLSGQSYVSLGSPEEADRIVSAAATLALFASNSPDELARLGGSLQQAEMVWGVEDGRLSGRGSLTTRARSRVDANTIRALQPGQCVLVSGGRAEKAQIIPAPRANNDLALPRRPFAVAGRVPRRLQPRQEPSVPSGRPPGALDPPGPDTARGHRSPAVGEVQPPHDRANQQEATP